jgi:hypothetical protein
MIFHRGDAENAEFFVGAEQKTIIHHRDTESTEFFVGAEQKPIIHHRDTENTEFFIVTEQKRRDAEATDTPDYRHNQEG